MFQALKMNLFVTFMRILLRSDLGNATNAPSFAKVIRLVYYYLFPFISLFTKTGNLFCIIYAI